MFPGVESKERAERVLKRILTVNGPHKRIAAYGEAAAWPELFIINGYLKNGLIRGVGHAQAKEILDGAVVYAGMPKHYEAMIERTYEAIMALHPPEFLYNSMVEFYSKHPGWIENDDFVDVALRYFDHYDIPLGEYMFNQAASVYQFKTGIKVMSRFNGVIIKKPRRAIDMS